MYSIKKAVKIGLSTLVIILICANVTINLYNLFIPDIDYNNIISFDNSAYAEINQTDAILNNSGISVDEKTIEQTNKKPVKSIICKNESQYRPKLPKGVSFLFGTG